MFDVLVVDDHLMQDDWMLLEHHEGATLVMRESARGCAKAMGEAWGAMRLLARRSTAVPRQRHPSGAERPTLQIV